MMFTKRHEEELAEIKALTYELGQRFQEIQVQLERIKETQDQLAARDRVGGGDAPATAGKRKAARTKAQATEGAKAAPKVAGAKKARGEESSTVVLGGDKSGKRRRVTSLGASEDAGEGGGGRKGRGGGRKGRGGGRKGRQAAAAKSSGEE